VALDRKEQAALLFRMIDQLPENQKVAFTLYKSEELSYQEIADVMKLSVSAVESLLFRSRQNLRKLLEKYYQQNNPQDK
jgi:RNA polymerase sigma-70 factor (ECF subfamily)